MKHDIFPSPTCPSDINLLHAEEACGGHLFGGANGDDYQTMGRWYALLAMTTNQLGLSILSLPACLVYWG